MYILLAASVCPPVKADQCNIVDLKDHSTGLPNLACCTIPSTEEVQQNECNFTSECNLHGVCCANHQDHPEYLPLKQMALEGQCCEHAGDCQTGICISGACWPKVTIDDTYHAKKQLAYIAAIVSVLLLACTLCCCCMRNLKMRIQFAAAPYKARGSSRMQNMQAGSGLVSEPTKRGL